MTFTPGAASGATTTITAAPTSVSVDVGSSSITVQAKDQYGNNLTSSGGTVLLSTTAGTLSAVTDNGNGTYSATLSDTVTRTDTVSGSIHALPITATASVTFTPGAASGATTTITAAPTSVSVDVGSSSITVQAKDQYGNNLTSSGGTVLLSTTAGTLSAVTDNGNGTYSATLSDTVTRTDTVSGSIDALPITATASVTFTPGAATIIRVETANDGSGTVLPAQTVVAGSSVIGYSITRDAYGNFVANAAATWTLAGSTGGVVSGDLVAAGDNKSATFTGHLIGTTRIHAAIALLGSTDSGTLTVTPGGATHLSMTGLTNGTAGTVQSATVTALDASNNVATGYAGTIHLTSTDTQAVLGPDAALTLGSGNFAVTLKTAGSRTVTATGSVGSITGSQTVMVSAAAANKLVFAQQPTGAYANDIIVPAVTVQVTDLYGNPTTASGSVGLTLSSGPGILSGTLPKTIDGTGLATFNDLSVSDIGTYTLTTTNALGLTNATSLAFNILPATTGLLADIATSDADFNHIDGFDVLFGNGSSSLKKLQATNPGTFHYELDLQNETGVTMHTKGRALPPIIRNGVSIKDSNGGSTVVIITIPALPTNSGTPIPASATAIHERGHLGLPGRRLPRRPGASGRSLRRHEHRRQLGSVGAERQLPRHVGHHLDLRPAGQQRDRQVRQGRGSRDPEEARGTHPPQPRVRAQGHRRLADDRADGVPRRLLVQVPDPGHPGPGLPDLVARGHDLHRQ